MRPLMQVLYLVMKRFIFFAFLVITLWADVVVLSDVATQGEDNTKTLDGVGFISVGFARAYLKKNNDNNNDNNVHIKYYTHTTTNLQSKEELQSFVLQISALQNDMFPAESKYEKVEKFKVLGLFFNNEVCLMEDRVDGKQVN